MERIWYLQGTDIFDGLAPEKEIFMSKAIRLSMRKNEILFNEGDPGNCCYYLASGLVRIYRIHGSGKEPVFFLRHKGELFGVSEVMDGYPRNANAQAVTDIEACKIERRDFDMLLMECYPLAKRVISLLGCRVRHLGDTIHNLIAGSVEDRLGKLLLALASNGLTGNYNWKTPLTLPHKISQEQLAQLAGTTQPTVSEILGEFQKRGIIKVEKRIITIISPYLLLDPTK